MYSPSSRRWPVAAAAGLLLLLASGCVARVGSDLSVPEDAAATCVQQCASIGLGMSAVAIMANTVGCVCQPAARTTAQNDAQAAAGATAGMATIMIQQQTEQQRQASQQRTP